MKLLKLTLHRLPGFKHRGFNLDHLSRRLNVIVGPNASGKTSICRAVQKILWIEKHKGFNPCSLDSEWEEGEISFAISLENGVRVVSERGKEAMQALPPESMSGCYLLSLDELFDGKDEAFAEKIATEISGGYDVEKAKKNLMTIPNARSAVKEWKEATLAFQEYERGQKDLEREKERLPFLDKHIQEAEEAKRGVFHLKQKIEAKKRFTQYEPFLPWVNVEISDEELARQGERLKRIIRLEGEEQNRFLPEIKKLEVALSHHMRLVGIDNTEVLEALCLDHLDLLEETWELLEQTESKVCALQEQLSLYEEEETLKRAFTLLVKIFSFPSIPSWMRWTFLLPLFPWIYFKIDVPKKRLEEEYRALKGVSPRLEDFRELGSFDQKKIKARLKSETARLEEYEKLLTEKGKGIGFSLLPTRSRYRFARLLKPLHDEWIHLKKAEQELFATQEALNFERNEWKKFASLFGEESFERIKEKREKASYLKNLERVPESLESLEALLKEQEAKAHTLLAFHSERAVLKNRLEEREASHAGQKLLQAQDMQFARVKKAAYSFVENASLDLLIQRAEAAFKRDSEPKVLERASLWFRKFTREAFLFEMSSGSLVYEAIETSTRERKSLETLSRGTRIQLLMAVRLSFATAPLPLFLDEVLANTDPERFEAVCEVLEELLKEGRQIFYLTSNPEEAHRLKKRDPEAHLIDLRLLQQEQAFLKAPLPLSLKAPLPKPTTSCLKTYARELKIPALNIREPLEMASTYYLVDTPEELYRFHTRGLLTYGHTASYDLGPLISKRQALLKAFYALRKQGRGLPLTKEVLEESNLSKKRVSEVWELAKEGDLDGKTLLMALEKREDVRTKGIHQKTVDELKETLILQGYLDERPLLDDEAIKRELIPLLGDEEHLGWLQRVLQCSAVMPLEKGSF